MSRSSVVLLVVIGVLLTISATTANKICPQNQVYTTYGSACPPSCNSPPDQVCPQYCVEGCQCKPGLVFNNCGNCVHPKQCKKYSPTAHMSKGRLKDVLKMSYCRFDVPKTSYGLSVLSGL